MISQLPEAVLIDGSDVTDEIVNMDRRPLRICMLAYAFFESDTRILQYATALAQRGDIVDVIALRRDKSFAEHEVIKGVNVFRIQARTVNEKGLWAYATRILRFLLHSTLVLHRRTQQHTYDAIHVHNVPDFLVFAAASAKFKGVPVILDIHDLLPEFYVSKFKISYKSKLFNFLCFVENCSASFADHIIIANDVWRTRLVQRSSQSEKCSVVRNRPDLDIFTKRGERDRKADGRFLMIYPGSLNWHQGLDIAIRAFASVWEQLPGCEFHIYGEGSAKPSLIELANQLHMQGFIFFHNFLPSHEIAQVMAKADLAIEPKRTKSQFSNDALSTKILEFMSLGVPVIACRTRIHAYYYDDSIIQYYEDDDEEQLAEQMLRLRRDEAARTRLVENAAKYVEQNTWDARKHEYLELVDSLVRTAAK